jgi:hypothetical protein
MINQAIRGSFECYINAGKEITSLDQVAEVNDDITNLDSSIDSNLFAINKGMEYDMKIKEKVEVNGKKLVNGKWIDLNHFIELSNVDKDAVVDKTVVEKVNNLHNIEKLNIVVDPEFDVVERRDFTNIDVSIMSDTDESDSDKESGEDNALFIDDGELDNQIEYVRILSSPSSRIWDYSRGSEV